MYFKSNLILQRFLLKIKKAAGLACSSSYIKADGTKIKQLISKKFNLKFKAISGAGTGASLPFFQRKYNYIIPFIFKTLGSNIPEDAEPIVTFSFNILILSLIVLFCLINITGYFISIYLINKYDVEKKFPKYSKLIRYYENSQIFYVIIEIFVCFFFLIIIIILNLGILGIFIFVGPR